VREQIVRVALTAVAVALVLFAVPLGVLVHNTLFTEEKLELERAALRAAVRFGPDFVTGDPVELPSDPTMTVGGYDSTFQLRTGRGPTAADAVVRKAATGIVADGTVDDALVVAVPITSAERVVGVVRASVATSVTWSHIIAAWLVLAGLATVALAAAVVVARRQARQLSAPLEQLARTSQQVADGDLTARAQPHPISEIGRVATAQNAMVDQLTALLERERTFSADASHQLRTPLTGLKLGLDEALLQARRPGFDPEPVLQDAVRQADQLERTVADLLQIVRNPLSSWPTVDPTPLDAALADAETRWHGPLAAQGRQLAIIVDPDVAASQVPGRAVHQILDILIHNASRHGVGRVTIHGRGLGDTTVIDVIDEGNLHGDPETLFARRPTHGGHRIGLPLARSLADASGGRLRLSSAEPTRFSLLLAEADAPTAPP
jgi:signal transduction histidine kinase